MVNPIIFQANNKGKCDTCGDNKYLDSMVRKEYKKGLYECIDCKVDKEAENIKYFKEILKLSDDDMVNIKAGKIKKIIKWAFG